MEEKIGIVMRFTPYKENDAMILAMCEEGFISFLARGVMKIESKNASSLSLYSFSKWTLETTKGGQLTLKSGQLLDSALIASNDLATLLAMDAIAELCLKMLDGEAKELYPYVYKVFSLLHKKAIEPAASLAIMAAQVLKATGYSFDVDGCVICHSNKKIVSFDYQSGGYICSKHFDPMTMHNQSQLYLKTIRYLFLVPCDHIGEVELPTLEVMEILTNLRAYFDSACGFKWKGLDSFFKIAKML